MGIASFSPLFGRTAGLSVLLWPVQAIVSLFVPAQAPLPHARQVGNTALAYRALTLVKKSPNLPATKPASKSHTDTPVQRLKIVREFEPGANRSCAGRLVISGRMADVCAELERLAG